MSYLNAAQIAGYASGAGCPDSALQMATAVALAESSGNTQAHNPVPPDDSYGLWQINMIGGLRAQRLAQYGLRSVSDLYDPAINAAIMVDLSNGCTRWSPTWGPAYTGVYQRYWAQAGQGVDAFLASRGTPPDTGTLPASEPSVDGAVSSSTDATAIDPGAILSDLGAVYAGVPTWAMIAIALGLALWILR